MRIGIIAGSRLLPQILAKNIKKKMNDIETIAICFKGETSKNISRYVDKSYWIEVGALTLLKRIIEEEKLKEVIMVGQIYPLRIFRKERWDKEMKNLIKEIEDFRPHTIFKKIIDYLEKGGVRFLDSTLYLKEYLSEEGVMNQLLLTEHQKRDIEFGMKVVSCFVDLDIGQTLVVKNKSVVSLEAIEGTDNTIKRAYKIAGTGCTVLKFSKSNQDLRFDVPVVGVSTLKLLKKVKASSLVLESGKVIILEKDKFLSLAKKYKIPIIGKERVN
jgi:hypothetical protein